MSRNYKEAHDKIWGGYDYPSKHDYDYPSEHEAEFRAFEEQVKSTELLTSVEAPVHILDFEEAATLGCGDKVQVFLGQVRSKLDLSQSYNIFQDHFMSRFDSISLVQDLMTNLW